MIEQQVETDIKLISNKSTNLQIVKLLAYITDVLKSGTEETITVNIGKNLKSDFFAIEVNGIELPQVKCKSSIDIN